MPNIKPILDLRNYTEVLKEVDVSNRVYWARSGHGQYGILTMAEIVFCDGVFLLPDDMVCGIMGAGSFELRSHRT